MYVFFFCTLIAPPGPPISPEVVSTDSTCINITFTYPQDTGRNDTYYTISAISFKLLGSDNGDSPVIIVQQNPDEVNHTVKISKLEPSTDYYICITSHNGVSDQDKSNEKLRKAELYASTSEGGK